tara:strand:- start:5665 stop:5862 length:198 start_codon:yes stop_codon:yes gene_type:complete
MPQIIYVDSVQIGDYTAVNGEDLVAAIHLSVTIPAELRADVDRNDTSRRELTGIIEAAIAAAESE